MENLIEALVSILKKVPDNPLIPEYIGIQSRGMKQWVSLEIARKTGICSNIHMLYPRQIIDLFISKAVSLVDKNQRLEEDIIFWSVFKQIHSIDIHGGLDTLAKYIEDDYSSDKKRYQLSVKIAKIFDDYQIYRPDIITNWENDPHISLFDDPVSKWQRILWQQIISQTPFDSFACGITRFLDHFDDMKIQPEDFPDRIFLFGISNFPPVFLQIFEKFSHIMDIHIFFLVPSNQYFYDLKSEKQLQKLSIEHTSEPPDDPLYYEMSNPLLSGLGGLNSNFLNILENFNYHEPFPDLFEDPLDESKTMLSWIQSDILNLVCRKNGFSEIPLQIQKQDSSVSIHACHSPMRETQVLKDILLKEFADDPDLSPDDIIVMMPDIESYAPYIEAVFSFENYMSFSISDRKKHSESKSLTAFLKILALKNTRLEKTQVLDLLLCEPVAEKFNISVEDLSVIQKMTDTAHILWGKDADHRTKIGLPSIFQNTWEFGLQRLFMGMAMPEDYDLLVKDILPCTAVEGLDFEILGKFSSFCQTVFSLLSLFEKRKPLQEWCHELNLIIDSFIEHNADNQEDISFLFHVIDDMKINSKKADFTEILSFDVIHAYIENKLEQNISHGNFLSGNITFCNLMPMRSIPYKIVALMGMDEKSFPRKSSGTGFDLLKIHPRSGDKNERDEDRQLFLETLLSARNKFVITYTGMNIQDNSPVPGSTVVSELCDTLNQSFIFEKNYQYHRYHPLHPFDENYFKQDTGFFSYSEHNYKIARALQNKNVQQNSFVPDEQSVSLKHDFSEAPSEIQLETLIRFFKNPVQDYMKETLNINFSGLEELYLDREPFSISGLEQYSIGDYLLDSHQVKNTTDLYPIIFAKGVLPFGEKGHLEYLRIESKARPLIEVNTQFLSKKLLPSIVTQLAIGDITVSSVLNNMYSDGAYFSDFGKLNGRRMLTAWIRHLFLNITAPDDYPCQTVLTGQDPEGKRPVVVYNFPAIKDKALEYFTVLMDIYKQGLQHPFWFFCETAWQIVKILEKDNFLVTSKNIKTVFNKSESTWHGSSYFQGECENRYIACCMGQNDPFTDIETFSSSDIIHNAIQIYRPLLENVRQIK